MVRPAVLVDLDGTLLDIEGMRDWAKGIRTDYHEFHRLAVEAPPIKEILEEVHGHYDSGSDILIGTARSIAYVTPTTRWLHKVEVPYHCLWMRPLGDLRPDIQLKAEMLQRITEQGWDVQLAYDDHPDVLQLWRDSGLPVREVPGWNL